MPLKLDGKVSLPAGRFFDSLTSIDELLKLLLKAQETQIKLLKNISGLPTTEPIARVAQELVNRYDIYVLDLSVAHTNTKIGLRDSNRVVKFLLWENVGAPLTYKLNSNVSKPLSASVGDSHDDWDIIEIYYSNLAVAGKTATLYVEWRQ